MQEKNLLKSLVLEIFNNDMLGPSEQDIAELEDRVPYPIEPLENIGKVHEFFEITGTEQAVVDVYTAIDPNRVTVFQPSGKRSTVMMPAFIDEDSVESWVNWIESIAEEHGALIRDPDEADVIGDPDPGLKLFEPSDWKASRLGMTT